MKRRDGLQPIPNIAVKEGRGVLSVKVLRQHQIRVPEADAEGGFAQFGVADENAALAAIVVVVILRSGDAGVLRGGIVELLLRGIREDIVVRQQTVVDVRLRDLQFGGPGPRRRPAGRR